MDGRPGRALRAGLLVCFRAEDGNALLWTSRMNCLPDVGHICTTIADGIEVDYQCESVRWEFLHENTSDPTGYVEGVAQYDNFIPSELTHAGPIVIVSEL